MPPGIRWSVAEAASLIDTARLRLGRATGDLECAVGERRQPDAVVQARIHLDAASGAVQRIRRDMEIALSYASIAFDTHRETYGRALLGTAGGPQGQGRSARRGPAPVPPPL